EGTVAIGEPRSLGLLALQVLVDREEVLNLGQERREKIVEVLHVGPRRVSEGNAQDLLIESLLVRHVEQADRTSADPASRKGGFAHENQRVERIAVLPER